MNHIPGRSGRGRGVLPGWLIAERRQSADRAQTLIGITDSCFSTSQGSGKLDQHVESLRPPIPAPWRGAPWPQSRVPLATPEQARTRHVRAPREVEDSTRICAPVPKSGDVMAMQLWARVRAATSTHPVEKTAHIGPGFAVAASRPSAGAPTWALPATIVQLVLLISRHTLCGTEVRAETTLHSIPGGQVEPQAGCCSTECSLGKAGVATISRSRRRARRTRTRSTR
jgi:hypothetical protein